MRCVGGRVGVASACVVDGSSGEEGVDTERGRLWCGVGSCGVMEAEDGRWIWECRSGRGRHEGVTRPKGGCVRVRCIGAL